MRYDEFVTTSKAQNLHNFLNRSLKRKTATFEDRLLNTYTIGSIKVLEINT